MALSEEKGKEKIADEDEDEYEDDDDDEEQLAHILETEILAAGSEPSDQEGNDADEEKQSEFSKKPRLERGGGILQPKSYLRRHMNRVATAAIAVPPARLIESGLFSIIPSELFHHILKFLSSEDLMSCSLVCRFMNTAASDESLWRRLYCMRWGMASPAGKLHTCPWKKLYIQRDREDMVDFVRNTPLEFREYYIQMQAAKRSQAPLASQVHDDSIILDKTVAEQVSIWKNNRGLTDDTVFGHDCSGKTCTYYHIGDVFLCEKTGRVHVCDDTCREVVLDLSTGTYVCTISGRCYDRWLSPDEEVDLEGQAGAVDELEPFMGSGRFARAYVLGYNCSDEKELETALRFC